MIDSNRSVLKIPHEHVSGELEKLGRRIDDATVIRHFWVGDDYRLQLRWPDGFSAAIGFGPDASEAIARWAETLKPRVIH